VSVFFGQENYLFISFPKEKTQLLDNQSLNTQIINFERRYSKLLVIRLMNDSSRFNARYQDFIVKHPDWGVIFHVWNSSKENMEYLKLSSSSISIRNSKVTMSISSELEMSLIKSKLKDAIIESQGKNSKDGRFYYEVSKNPDRYACVTGELFDYLFSDIELILSEVDQFKVSHPKQHFSANSSQNDDTLRKSINQILVDQKQIKLDLQELIKKINAPKKANKSLLQFEVGAIQKFSNNILSRGIYFSKQRINSFAGSSVKKGGFGFSLLQSNYFYSSFIDHSFAIEEKKIEISNLRERGELFYNSISFFGIYSFSFLSGLFPPNAPKDPLWISLKGGLAINAIQSSHFSWYSGSMNVRGKFDGIQDEIINVPELGFQDNISLVGINGDAQLKRLFYSIDLDFAIHYNLERFDFFAGGGFLLSSKIKSQESYSPIFDGHQYRSLIVTEQPISIRSPFISAGMSIIF
jgi:hypothetical protein